jgi:hypothetical protein
MFKLVIALLAIFGMFCLASIRWPSLFNEAVNMGGVSVSGVALLGGVIFLAVMKMGK